MEIGTTLCPECGQRSPVRLSAGQICASCRSSRAWSDNERLTVSREDIDAAVARRDRRPGKPIWVMAVSLGSLGLAGWATYALTRLFRTEPLRALDQLFASMRSDAVGATTWGAIALVVGIGAGIAVRRSRHFHRRLLLLPHLLAVVAGTLALVMGALHWWQLPGSSGMMHLTMPPLTAVERHPSVHFERVARATAVLLAPGGDGDGRKVSIGTAAIISRDDGHAWLVTCSHVAMPYAAVAAWRDPEDAWPLWVQFHDGRSATGKVVWAAPPPLDVAVLEVPLDNPPEPVDIAVDTAELDTGDPVLFVPNPYRDGWLVHHGEIERRRLHDTPAGSYSLLFTTLPVQPGDSGSGLFDENGMLIGLNTWSRIGRGEARGISLPAETLQTLVRTIEEDRMHELDQLLTRDWEKP